MSEPRMWAGKSGEHWGWLCRECGNFGESPQWLDAMFGVACHLEYGHGVGDSRAYVRQCKSIGWDDELMSVLEGHHRRRNR